MSTVELELCPHLYITAHMPNGHKASFSLLVKAYIFYYSSFSLLVKATELLSYLHNIIM